MCCSDGIKIFEYIGKSILSYIKETYSPGRIVFCIDPYIWNECTSELENFSEQWKMIKRDLRLHSIIAKSDNNIAKLALAAFQIQLMNRAKNENAFNQVLSKELGIKVEYLHRDYYRRIWDASNQTMQEKIFLGAQLCLAEEGFGVAYPNYDLEQMGRPNCYVNFPKSQSLQSLSPYFRYSDCRLYWPKIWEENGWNPKNADITEFENEFKGKMQRNINEKYFDGSGKANYISLINNYLYGYFSKIWDTEQTRNVEKKYSNEYELYNFNVSCGIASFELKKNNKKVDNFPEHLIYKPEKKNTLFKLDEVYQGYALQVDYISKTKKYDGIFLLFIKKSEVAKIGHSECVKLCQTESPEINIAIFHGLNDEIIRLFNLRTGEPLIEYIGGLYKNGASRTTICLDFSIPKIKINSQENNSVSIDRNTVEIGADKIVNIDKYERNKTHHIRIGRNHKKFKILDEKCYDEFSEEQATCSGWVIEKGKRIKIAEEEHPKGCYIDGLNCSGIDNDDYERILYREINRFKMKNLNNIGNNVIMRRKDV